MAEEYEEIISVKKLFFPFEVDSALKLTAESQLALDLRSPSFKDPLLVP